MIDCLENILDLYSGKEFSKRHVLKELYEHDVEFTDNNKVELNARPYKASGICLEQLRACVVEMVENEIMSPGDSRTVSPVFFVTKNKAKIRPQLVED